MDNEKNKTEKSTLYLVATPIGNLADISERAKKILTEVDFVAAEDTRNTQKLLSCLGIKNELVSYHEHNKAAAGERIIARILSGESCALVTDAGMPAISDPGEDLVRLAADSGIRVSVSPGASAVVSALALSALPTAKFTFEGFLPANRSQRKKELSSLAKEMRTMVFYEAPHKLAPTLADMLDVFGSGRRISLCRELTKLNEEVIRTTLGEAVEKFPEGAARGEFVLVVEGASKDEIKQDNPLSLLSPEAHVQEYEKQGLKRMEAIKAAAKDRGISKSELYKMLLDSE